MYIYTKREGERALVPNALLFYISIGVCCHQIPSLVIAFQTIATLPLNSRTSLRFIWFTITLWMQGDWNRPELWRYFQAFLKSTNRHECHHLVMLQRLLARNVDISRILTIILRKCQHSMHQVCLICVFDRENAIILHDSLLWRYRTCSSPHGCLLMRITLPLS